MAPTWFYAVRTALATRAVHHHRVTSDPMTPTGNHEREEAPVKMTITTTTGATGAFVLPGCPVAASVAGARPRVAVGRPDAVALRATTSARDAVDVLTPVHVRPGGDDG
jgi:hypothetical protein